MVNSFTVIQKDGNIIKFMLKNREVHMMSEGTGTVWINMGYPLDMKKKILMSRNKLPSYFEDFIRSWKQEDIDKVAAMNSDEEMAEDMMNDFRIEGHEIIPEVKA